MSKREKRLVGDGQLTPKQEAFVQYYLSEHKNPNGYSTLYNQTQSALAAGYGGGKAGEFVDAEPGSVAYLGAAKQGWIGVRNPKIVKRIRARAKELFGYGELTIDKVLIELEELRVLSLRKGRLGTAFQCIEAKGRYLKMFVDRIEHLVQVEDSTTGELVDLLKSLIGDIPNLSFDEVMESVGASGTDQGDGRPAESSVADSEGTPSPD